VTFFGRSQGEIPRSAIFGNMGHFRTFKLVIWDNLGNRVTFNVHLSEVPLWDESVLVFISWAFRLSSASIRSRFSLACSQTVE
jgi:hypothetical protein